MSKVLSKNKKGILLMVLSSLCVCTGQLFWKISTSSESIWFLLIGFLFYVFGAIVMLVAYRFGKLSILQPILSLNYIISIVLGYLLLNEIITILKVIGVLVIIIGVIFVATGEEK